MNDDVSATFPRSPSDERRAAGVDVLREACVLGACDPGRLRSWLLGGTGFPQVWGAQDPYRAILEAVEAFDEPEEADFIRRALAFGLAGVINRKPEATVGINSRAMLMVNTYELAARLGAREPKLNDAIRDALGRGVSRTPDPRGPLGRYLFDAAVVNQTESELEDFWFDVLRNPAAHQRKGTGARFRVGRLTDWNVKWWHALRAIINVAADKQPNIVAKALGIAMRNITRDMGADPEVDRQRWFRRLVGEASSEGDVWNILRVQEGLPDWVRRMSEVSGLKEPGTQKPIGPETGITRVHKNITAVTEPARELVKGATNVGIEIWRRTSLAGTEWLDALIQNYNTRAINRGCPGDTLIFVRNMQSALRSQSKI